MSAVPRAAGDVAGPAGATLQLLQEAQQKMGLGDDPNDAGGTADDDGPKGRVRRAARRCWALLLARIYECLPLLCPTCGQPMRIIAFILERPVIEQILGHMGEPTTCSDPAPSGTSSGLTGPAAPAGGDGIRPGSGACGMAGHGSNGGLDGRHLGVNHRKETRDERSPRAVWAGVCVQSGINRCSTAK